jgi:hypothetical protein
MPIPEEENESYESLEAFKKRKRSRLLNLLKMLYSGELDSSKSSKDSLFNQSPPRFDYVGPQDRSAFNSGYMDSPQYTREETGDYPGQYSIT